ncbi:hypothetical protein ES703_06712 [subsurface metagenome]
MKAFKNPNFNPLICRKEIEEFKKLLYAKTDLQERADILPFFKQRKHLSTYIGTFITNMKSFDRIAYEFELYGDFLVDLVVGDSKRNLYLFVEFEAGTDTSMFCRKGKKSTLQWSPAFESGFSQIIDWFWILDGMRNTPDFRSTFGSSEARIFAMLVAGRSRVLEDAEIQRLAWREEKVVINSNRIFCLTYDALCTEMYERAEYESKHWEST